MDDFERVLCVKKEVFVYRIPARTTNRGYRAADWKLDLPDWTGRLKIVSVKQEVAIKLEDKTTGELFAKCPVEAYPGIAVESVLDSSRYFVLRIQDETGRNAFIGIGFADRSDSFDLNVALQDHFKQVKRDVDAESAAKSLDEGPKLNLGFKEGQTIKININTKKAGDGEGKSRARSRPQGAGGGGIGLLPPPPGGVKIQPPPTSTVSQPAFSQPTVQPTQIPASTPASSGQNSNVDLLLDLGGPATTSNSNNTSLQQSTQPPAVSQNNDLWGDFASSGTTDNSSSNNWVDFN